MNVQTTTPSNPAFDEAHADLFLRQFAPAGEKFNFRTIAPKRGARNHFGTLTEVASSLASATADGAAAFFQVNATDGCGHKAENVVRVRALFLDLDGAPIQPVMAASLKPHIVVESSPGKFHAYYLVCDCPLDSFKPVQQALARKFDGDLVVCDLPRIMRLPGSVHAKGTPWQSRIVEQSSVPAYPLQKIIDSLELEVDVALSRSAGSKRLDITEGLPDGERTAALTQLCGHLVNTGWSDEQCMVTLRGWNAQHPEPLDEAKLRSTLEGIRKTHQRNHPQNREAFVEDFNQTHAVVLHGSKPVVLMERDEDIVLFSFEDFKKYYCNLPPINGIAATTAWLSSPDRRAYEGLALLPGRLAPDGIYNLWRGFTTAPAEGNFDLYLQLLREGIADSDEEIYEYILSWLADLVQNPGHLPGIALVLLGAQGVGKGVFAREIGALFGSHFCHIQNGEQLTGKFSFHLATSVFVFVDEAVWAGDYKREGVLKGLVSEPRRVAEAKFKDPIEVDNVAHFIFATNDPWAVPAGPMERRFAVFEVGSRFQQDSKFFAALRQEMDSGGREALLKFLLERDLSDFDIRAFPRRDALLGQKIQSLRSVPAWWYECLQNGAIGSHQWPDWLPTKVLHDAYQQHQMQGWYRRSHAASASVFARELTKLACFAPRRRNSVHLFGTTAAPEQRVRGYEIPPLFECRRRMDAFLGQAGEWDDE